MLSSHVKENDGGWAKARKTKSGLFLAKKKKSFNLKTLNSLMILKDSG